MGTREALLEAMAPLAQTVARLDLNDRAVAEAALEHAHPFASLEAIGRLLRAGRDEGWLVPREATPTLRFGRLAKAGPELHGHSIDVVDMSGAGARHGHPNGEVSLCFPEAGEPVFEGSRGGWVVLPPGSVHVPEVDGGRMLIAYLLPGGAMDW